MFTFWIIAALFILFTLWFVLPSLLQKTEEQKPDELREANVLVYQSQYQELEADLKNGLIGQEQYQQDKEELERRLLEDVKAARARSASWRLVSTRNTSSPSSATRRLAYGVGAGIPIAAIALYLVVGNPKALTSSSRIAEVAVNKPGITMTQSQIEANVEKLARRLEQNPNDAQGWAMLGRSYMILERYSEAASAYARATTLNGNDASAWADYAEALAMANGQRMAGKPAEAASRALQIDPQNPKALALAGSAAFEAKDYRKAVDYWQKLVPLLPAGSEAAKTVSDQIAKAKELAASSGSR